MSEFSDVKTKRRDTIYGFSQINHAKRHKMGLSIAEYCVADFIEYAASKRKPVTYEYIWRRLAFDKENFLSLAKNLQTKGYIVSEDNQLKVTRLWLDEFMVSDEWFDAFWFVKGKVFWPGPKKDAQAKFVKACKFFQPEFLIECRDNYIKFMAHPDNAFRQVMGASVFLNLETERFKQDWPGDLRRLKNPMEKLPRQEIPRIEFTKETSKQLFQ